MTGCDREVEEGCDVFNRPRSEMLQVEDAELVEACLESKHTRHQLQKNPIYTERGSEDRHWLSQDGQYRSPTHRSRDAES